MTSPIPGLPPQECILVAPPSEQQIPEVERGLEDFVANRPIGQTHNLGMVVCKAEGCTLTLGEYLEMHGGWMQSDIGIEEAKGRLEDLVLRLPSACALRSVVNGLDLSL